MTLGESGQEGGGMEERVEQKERLSQKERADSTGLLIWQLWENDVIRRAVSGIYICGSDHGTSPKYWRAARSTDPRKMTDSK